MPDLGDESPIAITSSAKSIGSSVSRQEYSKRRVDYVLAWEESLTGTTNSLTPSEVTECRRVFEESLREAGVEVDEETTVISKKTVHFIKLYVPWDTMCQYAESLNMRVPVVPFTRNSGAEDCCSSSCLNLMTQAVAIKLPLMCAHKFTKANESKYYGIKDKDHFFKPTQRHRVAYEILVTRVYGAVEKGEIGIDRLLKLGVYSSAYPLHEGPHALPDGKIGCDFNPEDLNPRQILHAYWASYGRWYEFQPLDHIREYFGEKIAFYFAFLGLFTAWLLLATAVGIGIFSYNCIYAFIELVPKEACSSGKEYRMCPRCADGCSHWYLSDICAKLRLAHIFDGNGIAACSIFISCWAVLLLEYWKRQNAALAHRWSVSNLSIEEERPRPGYSLMCTEFRENSITGTVEPYFPHRKRIMRFVASIVCILVMLVIISIPISLTADLEKWFNNLVYTRRPLSSLVSTIPVGVVFTAMVQLILLLIFELLSNAIVYRLNKWEMHRTQADMEEQLILKEFVCQFVNYFMPLFFVAVLKRKGQLRFGVRLSAKEREEEAAEKPTELGCSEGGCMLDLAIQLAVFMIGKQVHRCLVDIVWPLIQRKLQRCGGGLTEAPREGASPNQWEGDYVLIEHNGLHGHYLHAVLLFGFVTLFGAAFPLAPLFALISNLVEIRLDAWKLVCFTRRPLSERVQGIGVWLPLMQFIACVSVVSNALVLALTSEGEHKGAYTSLFNRGLQGYLNLTTPFLPVNSSGSAQPCRVSYHNIPSMYLSKGLTQTNAMAFVARFSVAFYATICVSFACYLLSCLVPMVPKSVLDSARRENYLVDNALAAFDADNSIDSSRWGASEEEEDDMSRVISKN